MGVYFMDVYSIGNFVFDTLLEVRGIEAFEACT